MARSLLGRPAPFKSKRQSELIEKHVYTTASTSESNRILNSSLKGGWLREKRRSRALSCLVLVLKASYLLPLMD